MSDIGYVWDERKYREVERTHGLDLLGVLEAFVDPRALQHEDPQDNWERYMTVGATRSGVILQVIYSDEELPLIRLVTAYRANDHWRREYERRSRE